MIIIQIKLQILSITFQILTSSLPFILHKVSPIFQYPLIRTLLTFLDSIIYPQTLNISYHFIVQMLIRIKSTVLFFNSWEGQTKKSSIFTSIQMLSSAVQKLCETGSIINYSLIKQTLFIKFQAAFQVHCIHFEQLLFQSIYQFQEKIYEAISSLLIFPQLIISLAYFLFNFKVFPSISISIKRVNLLDDALSRFIVQINIMSILLIGQKNPIYYSPQYSKSSQIPHYLRQKKVRQDQYRLDLLDQIRQKQSRLRRQRQIDEQYDRKYQANLNRTPNQSISYNSNPHNNQNNYHFLDKSIGEDRYTTPTTYKSNKNIFSTSPNYDFSHLNTKKRHSRVKTQSLSSEAFNQFTESYEKRKQQLQDYENKKIGEVYEKMYNSVQVLNEQDQQQYQLIKSRFKPIKLNIDHKKHRIKYTPKISQQNPQDQFYKLPRIINYNNPNQYQQESNWRQWYAKQKLKQLQTYYKRKLIDNQVRERMENDNRARTPAFR